MRPGFVSSKLDMEPWEYFWKEWGREGVAECWWCGQAEQSGDHLYINHRKWRYEGRVLERTCSELEYGGNADSKDRGQLNNEQAINPLLKYLMSTKLRGREGEADKAAERDQRADPEG